MTYDDESFGADFVDKGDLILLTEQVRDVLLKDGITSRVWSLHPMRIEIYIQTSQDDYAATIYKLFRLMEVKEVETMIEPSLKRVILGIDLKNNWYQLEGKHGEIAKRHPEDDAGA